MQAKIEVFLFFFNKLEIPNTYGQLALTWTAEYVQFIVELRKAKAGLKEKWIAEIVCWTGSIKKIK